MIARYVPALLAGLAVLTGNAHAQSAKCGPRADVVKVLTEKYHEVSVSIGMVDDKLLMEEYVSPKGTWTIFVTRADGISCIVLAGDNWQADTKAFDDAKKGEVM